jgi:hypothetical protein
VGHGHKLDGPEPTVKAVRKQLGIHARQIDSKYGVVAIRPEKKLYAVRVDVDVAEAVRREHVAPKQSRKSDTRVAPVH